MNIKCKFDFKDFFLLSSLHICKGKLLSVWKKRQSFWVKLVFFKCTELLNYKQMIITWIVLFTMLAVLIVSVFVMKYQQVVAGYLIALQDTSLKETCQKL